MLVTLSEILKLAEAGKMAIGSFNTPNLTALRAVIYAAEEENKPVIIMHAQVHEEQGHCKMDEVAPIMRYMADRARVPVCMHLDHGTDLDYVKRGLDLGFTSVMYDGSTLPRELNYANTAVAANIAHRMGASIEAEIGSMGVRESGSSDDAESVYTDPDEAKNFVDETGIDALACAFGTTHGVYLKKPKLDFPRLEKIHSLVDVPLVMHGGSGISEDDYRKVISLGIRKINYYTYMAKAGAAAVAQMADKSYFHDMEDVAMNGMKQDVKRAISIFAIE